MVKTGRSGLVAVVAVLSVAFLAGCGGALPGAKPSPTGPKTNGLEKLSTSKIIDRAVEASAGAESVHVVGKSREDGADVEMDIKLKKGEGGVGHVITDGLRLDLIMKGETIYMKGDKKFWDEVGGDAQVSAMLAGKWVKTTSKDKDMVDLADVLIGDKLFEESLTYTGGQPNKGKPEELNGQLVLPLIDRDGQKAYIALTGEPRILKLKEKGAGYETTFTYDVDVELKEPPAKEVFDLTKLGG